MSTIIRFSGAPSPSRELRGERPVFFDERRAGASPSSAASRPLARRSKKSPARARGSLVAEVEERRVRCARRRGEREEEPFRRGEARRRAGT
jgi:hypothetical protein